MRTNEVQLYTECAYDVIEIQKHIADSGVLDLICKGDRVVVKPNFVQEKDSRNNEWEHVITHPTVVTAVINLVCEKLNGLGSVIVADAPMCPTRFDELIAHFPVDEWRKTCNDNNIEFQIIDLRNEEWWIASNAAIIKKAPLPSDPLGSTLCNLKNDKSEFYGKTAAKGFYGADYDSDETNRVHDGDNNWYSVSKSVMSADVFINLPKMKSHRKAGITCCLKNLVGINTNKNYLPHHSNGTPDEGGDQYDSNKVTSKIEGRTFLAAKKFVSKVTLLRPLLVPIKSLGLLILGKKGTKVRGGGWYGNDTLWRTIIDLNKVLLYSDADGNLSDENAEPKRYIAIVDGIIAGEHNGPLEPDRKECGYLLIGTNPVSVDSVAAYLMGFDYKKIPSLAHSFEVKKYKLIKDGYDSVLCSVDGNPYCKIEKLPSELINPFVPADGWKDHIEMKL